MIGHIKIDDPGVALFQFLMLNAEHFALYDHRAHIQIQFLHGNRISLKGSSENGRIVFCLFFLFLHDGRFGKIGQNAFPHLFHRVKKRLSL